MDTPSPQDVIARAKQIVDVWIPVSADTPKLLALIRDLVAALEARQQGWQPIETAPKERGQLLGWFPMPGGASGVYVMYWNDDKYAKKPKPVWDVYGWMWGRATLREFQPTHWMPLPEPVEARASSEDGR